VPLASGALVYRPLPRLWLKANYSEGFRPPAVEFARARAELVFRPRAIQPERSRAAQVELRAVPLERLGPLRRLSLQLAYTYARIEHLIGAERTPGAIQAIVSSREDPIAVDSIDANGEVELRRARAWARFTHNRFSFDEASPAPLFDRWVVVAGTALRLWIEPLCEPYVALLLLGPAAIDVLGAARPPVPLVEAGLTVKRLPGGLDVGVFGRNLAGVTWYQPLLGAVPGAEGIPQPGRSVFGRIRWSWF
jgi:hypothetical protein